MIWTVLTREVEIVPLLAMGMQRCIADNALTSGPLHMACSTAILAIDRKVARAHIATRTRIISGAL